MKSFTKILFGMGLIYSTTCLAELSISRGFDAEKCANGHANRWAGACICYEPTKFSGKYCSEDTIHPCFSNNDCPKNSFCLAYQRQGSCFKNQVRDVLESPKAIYVLSDSLLSYFNVKPFCDSLGVGFHPISRQDFHCDSEGASCLDRELMLQLQNIFGNRGFFWLDEKVGSDNAYYADLNDGTVYNTTKDNIKSCQVLCIKEKNQ